MTPEQKEQHERETETLAEAAAKLVRGAKVSEDQRARALAAFTRIANGQPAVPPPADHTFANHQATQIVAEDAKRLVLGEALEPEPRARVLEALARVLRGEHPVG